MSVPTYTPAGYHTATPSLVVADANAALQWYARVFNASEHFRVPATPSGTGIVHAEFSIGDTRFKIGEPAGRRATKPPQQCNGASVSFYLYVQDCDTTFNTAVQAGATAVSTPELQSYGDKLGTLIDPFGHVWSLATHVTEPHH